MAHPVIGRLYWVWQGEKRLPTPWRYEGAEKLHCQLHGEYYGVGWRMRRRRNSDIRPWGRVSVFAAEGTRIEPAGTEGS